MLTAADVAAMLGLKPRTVYDIPVDQLPRYRLGAGRGAVRFEQADVEAYKASCKVVVRQQVAAPPLRGTTVRFAALVPVGVTELDRAFAKLGVKPRKARPHPTRR